MNTEDKSSNAELQEAMAEDVKQKYGEPGAVDPINTRVLTLGDLLLKTKIPTLSAVIGAIIMVGSAGFLIGKGNVAWLKDKSDDLQVKYDMSKKQVVDMRTALADNQDRNLSFIHKEIRETKAEIAVIDHPRTEMEWKLHIKCVDQDSECIRKRKELDDRLNTLYRLLGNSQ